MGEFIALVKLKQESAICKILGELNPEKEFDEKGEVLINLYTEKL